MLDIYLFGNGWGESILLNIEGEYSALIDCYDFGSTSLIKRKLEELNIKKLDLLAITHPHLDHFKDIYECEKQMQPTKLVTFGSDSLGTYGAYFEVLSKMAKSAEKKNALRKMSEEFQRLKSVSENFQSLQEMLIKSAEERKHNHVKVSGHGFIDKRPSVDLEIISVLPLVSDPKLIERQLLALIRASGLTTTLSDNFAEENNLVNGLSVGLLVSYKGNKALFCSDSNSENMKTLAELNAEKNNGGMLNSVGLIKISHHGSPHGNPDEFWSHLASVTTNPKLICTYYSGKLPDYKTMEKVTTVTNSSLFQPKAKYALGTTHTYRIENDHPLKISIDDKGIYI